jgi:hypothetical protein
LSYEQTIVGIVRDHPSAARGQRSGATTHAHADPERNSSSVVAGPHCIKGQVNIFNLAKNAGTPVDQIERFYARNLSLSREMAINLNATFADTNSMQDSVVPCFFSRVSHLSCCGN